MEIIITFLVLILLFQTWYYWRTTTPNTEYDHKVETLTREICNLNHQLETISATKVDRELYETQLKQKKIELDYLKFERDCLKADLLQKETELSTELSKKKSEQVRLGQISENLVPFLENFKYNPKNLAPIFNPIDYICFEEDKIVFIEVKTGNSQLSQKQKNIKRLVEEGKVEFEEFRIK